MTGLYFTDIDQVLRAAGLTVRDDGPNAGWQTRARSSGGFPDVPLAVFFHHTASDTSIGNDLSWQCDGCDDAPVGNMTIDRDGVVWPVAAGASNCAGKGGPASFSRGTIPLDSGNTRGWNVEVCNDGVGQRWPIAQVNSYLVAAVTLSAYFGNQPSDVITHALGSGDGWTDRKIDPATADAVEGPWQPTACNSSGTWLLADIRAECLARAGAYPPTNGDDDVTDDDINRIAEAVWARLLHNYVDGSDQPAGAMVSFAHLAASDTWNRPVRNIKADEDQPAGALLGFTHAEAFDAARRS